MPPYRPSFKPGAVPKNGSTVFRGISQDEHDFVVRNQGIRSNQSHSINGEGTCFGEDWKTAEDYVNAGSTSPTKTGKPSYVLEVEHGPDIGYDQTDGYWKTGTGGLSDGFVNEPRIKRVWQFTPEGHIAEGAWERNKGFSPIEPHKPYHRWHWGPERGEYDSRQEANGPVETFVSPLQKSFLEVPIGHKISDGDEATGGKYDYSHMLTPEHRSQGYEIHVEHGPDELNNEAVEASILHNGNHVGGIHAYMGDWHRSLVDPRQTHRAVEFSLSDLEDDHQGKGLGPAAYKAVILHARSLLGATHVKGGVHSTMAHRVHSKIASELGVVYSPELNPAPPKRSLYDEKYLDYEYPILKQSEPEPLIKMQAFEDFKGILGALDPAGANVVDHTHHLKAHPPELESGVGRYAQTFLYNPSIVRKVKSPKLGGISKKVVFDDGNSNWFMVKPYHERITRGVKSYMERPHQGWAEMTNQALFHAAGIGHLHQKVHTAEHNMGAGHENEPALVVHMEPGMKEIHELQPQHFHESMLHDATKIATMDFLANNLDRHGANLLFRPAEAHDPAKHYSRLLAIDHGRNFQYKTKTKWVRDELRAGAPKESILEDSLANYFGNGAIHAVSSYSAADGGHRVSSPTHYVQTISQWWPSVREEVMRTMHQHVASIKDQRHRDHIWKNFAERVNKLDDICRFPEEYENAGRELLDTPIYPAEESEHAYNPWQKEWH